ncbi:hypothetical protein CXB51_010802 [Gossypium anomalum]|uniref:Reverse transcriptase n=1 Tax=Gossypium anomalum TaxID=47600 RepID=A0A8J5Z315_9ROSI|nr:hypothetical protein CXB51_010802 [Gossypium anomalum]
MTEKTLSKPSTSSISISLPSTPFKSHSEKKISSLYEVEYLDEESKIQPEISGAKPTISAVEATLNWQTENALAQNYVLNKMDSKLSTVEAKIDDNTKLVKDLIKLLQKRIESVAREPAAPGQDFFSHLAQREKEIQKLQAQIKELKETGKIPEPVRRPETIELFPSIRNERLPESEGISIIFPEPIKRTKPKIEDQAYQEEKKLGKRLITEESPPQSPPKQVSKSLMIQEDKNPITTFLKSCHEDTIPKISAVQIHELAPVQIHDSSESETESSSTTILKESISTNGEIDNIPNIHAATKVEEPSDEEIDEPESSTAHATTNQHQPSSGGKNFTIDDLPPEKWPQRLQEFHSWLETRKLKEDSNYNILMEFVSRFTGMLRDWWNSINQHDQMQFLVFQDLSEPIRILHQHFIGNPEDLLVLRRREFYARKCCSFKKKDLTKHLKKMFQLFCALGLHPNLKPVILSSLPGPIQIAVNQALQQKNRDILQLTVGQIQQEVFIALEDICNRRKVFKDYLLGDRRIDQACDDSHLRYKCPKEGHCDCRTKKKKHYKRFPGKSLRKTLRWRYLRKKRKGSRKSNRCYICNKSGHYAKDCPKSKKKKAKKVIQMICHSGIKMQEDDDIESVCSLDDSPSTETICAIPVYDSDESQHSDYGEIFMFQAQAQAQIGPPVLAPNIPVKVYTDKYSKPITVIAFVDTGSAESIMNPDILPEDWWKPHTKIFSAADGKLFSTNLISHPITVQILPNCTIRTTVLRSKLPGKDLIIGFDLYTKIKNLRILPDGIRFKTFFQPYVHIPKLFSLQLEKTLQIIQEIREKSCANSHSEFLAKCPNPLWKNPEFFINLPFKKNEDINPTKASHTGMNPEHLLLAQQECKELQQQDLIEPSNSQWACEAFYVNKRSEQIRGKPRLVINYQPLNHFLQDNKFPLPNNNALFASLAKAKIFSKFDLKAGFWQLGIHPEDRGKTGFCIPNQHFQWKVMPFGLKTAPSLFQKAMTRIFHPIMENALVYIDDILLYSKDEEFHVLLLQQFHSLVVKYGIMLSEKKMNINKSEINFFGMDIKDGRYQPQPHIAQELLKFPDKNLSQKQVQQFYGIINYIRDFIEKISVFTNPLRKMLKKNPPPWTEKQTKAIQKIKQIAQEVPPLQIPSDGKRILQTDASDKYWGAVLLEEIDGRRRLCGYKSGKFSEAEKHYHSTFKEILAVKYGISKFQFHLKGYHFLVEMDMSSFPKMLKFKQKTVPHPQLLRWAQWFSEYSFDTKHIKGKENVLADFLSRPKPEIQLNRKIFWPKPIMMYRPYSSSSTSPTSYPVTPNLNPEFPPEVYRLTQNETFHQKAKDMMFEYQIQVFKNFGGLILKSWGVHPDYPFIHPINFQFLEQPEELKWFLWYLTHLYHIAIQFSICDLIYFLTKAIRGNIEPEHQNFFTFLSWFHPLPQWLEIIHQSCKQEKETCEMFIVIIFYKPQYFVHCGRAKQLDAEAPWDTWPRVYQPYHEGILKALKDYCESIPDPTEWSQDYLWQCSQVNLSRLNFNNDVEDKHMLEDVTEKEEDSDDSMDSSQYPHSNRNS